MKRLFRAIMRSDAKSKAWLERANDRISLWTDRTGNHLEFPIRVVYWLVILPLVILPAIILLIGGMYFGNYLSARLYAFLVYDPMGIAVMIVMMVLMFAHAFLSGYRKLPKLKAARKRAGLCFACGYDLRASPGRCPECGAAQDNFVIR